MTDDYTVRVKPNMTKEEAELRYRIVELENRDKKEDQQRRMASWAMAAVILTTAFLLSPWVDVERVSALSDLIGMFYIAQAGIIATFFGSSAYIQSHKSSTPTTITTTVEGSMDGDG